MKEEQTLPWETSKARRVFKLGEGIKGARGLFKVYKLLKALRFNYDVKWDLYNFEIYVKSYENNL